jgi:DNA-binding GntR family transcriptional regulator
VPQRPLILSDETYATIRAMIFAHDIVPGDRVNIDSLSLQLGVSQTPIREALARLDSENLITKEPLKGYRATNLLSEKEFADLFSFRLLIEPFAAEQAAILIDAQGIKAINNEIINAKTALNLKSESPMGEIAKHDTRFHTLITTYSGNKSLKNAFLNTNCHLHLFRLYMAAQRNSIKTYEKNHSDQGLLAIRQHIAIAKAIASHNPEKAKAEMRRHIESSLKSFTPILQQVHIERQQRQAIFGDSPTHL